MFLLKYRPSNKNTPYQIFEKEGKDWIIPKNIFYRKEEFDLETKTLHVTPTKYFQCDFDEEELHKIMFPPNINFWNMFQKILNVHKCLKKTII